MCGNSEWKFFKDQASQFFQKSFGHNHELNLYIFRIYLKFKFHSKWLCMTWDKEQNCVMLPNNLKSKGNNPTKFYLTGTWYIYSLIKTVHAWLRSWAKTVNCLKFSKTKGHNSAKYFWRTKYKFNKCILVTYQCPEFHLKCSLEFVQRMETE